MSSYDSPEQQFKDRFGIKPTPKPIMPQSIPEIEDYSDRKDTMPEDDKLMVAVAIKNGYSLELFDLSLDINHLTKILRISPNPHLIAKREAEAYKKGYIDGGLSNLKEDI